MGGILFVDRSMYYWLLLIFVIDANITGELILVSDLSSFEKLGYTLQESLRIVCLVKSLVECVWG